MSACGSGHVARTVNQRTPSGRGGLGRRVGAASHRRAAQPLVAALRTQQRPVVAPPLKGPRRRGSRSRLVHKLLKNLGSPFVHVRNCLLITSCKRGKCRAACAFRSCLEGSWGVGFGWRSRSFLSEGSWGWVGWRWAPVVSVVACGVLPPRAVPRVAI